MGKSVCPSHLMLFRWLFAVGYQPIQDNGFREAGIVAASEPGLAKAARRS